MVSAGTWTRAGLIGLMCLIVAGCASIYRNHGYAPTEAELSQIVVGKDTRETVAAQIGRPSTGGLMADGAWFYVQSRWEHRGGRAPVEIERQVLSISFDSKGVVENVERFGLEQGRVVPISRRITESNIKGLGLIQQLLGNIGNVNAGQFLDRSRS